MSRTIDDATSRITEQFEENKAALSAWLKLYFLETWAAKIWKTEGKLDITQTIVFERLEFYYYIRGFSGVNPLSSAEKDICSYVDDLSQPCWCYPEKKLFRYEEMYDVIREFHNPFIHVSHLIMCLYNLIHTNIGTAEVDGFVNTMCKNSYFVLGSENDIIDKLNELFAATSATSLTLEIAEQLIDEALRDPLNSFTTAFYGLSPEGKNVVECFRVKQIIYNLTHVQIDNYYLLWFVKLWKNRYEEEQHSGSGGVLLDSMETRWSELTKTYVAYTDRAEVKKFVKSGKHAATDNYNTPLLFYDWILLHKHIKMGMSEFVFNYENKLV